MPIAKARFTLAFHHDSSLSITSVEATQVLLNSVIFTTAASGTGQLVTILPYRLLIPVADVWK
jgi:hypothetical protein